MTKRMMRGAKASKKKDKTIKANRPDWTKKSGKWERIK